VSDLPKATQIAARYCDSICACKKATEHSINPHRKKRTGNFYLPLAQQTGDGKAKGEASDALDECVKKYPLADRAYYGRPATKEQVAKIKKINASCAPNEPILYDFEEEEPDEPLTYGEAKEIIRDWEREKEKAYFDSDESKIEDMTIAINAFSDFARKVTRKQVAEAWAIVKPSNAVSPLPPKQIEIENTLELLYPNLVRKRKFCTGF